MENLVWQDLVLMVGQFVFFLSLIPIVRSKEKPPLLASIPTAIVLTVYIPTLWSLHLYISVISTILVTLGWWVIAIQKILQRKAN